MCVQCGSHVGTRWEPGLGNVGTRWGSREDMHPPMHYIKCGALLVGVRLGRRVAFASDSKEVILVSTPVPRTQIPVKARTAFGQASGEATTHDSSYTGVPPMTWHQMPRVSASDKARIWGADSERPRQELFDTALGQPLLWQERKTPAFWSCLLADLCAKTVIDLTRCPGVHAARHPISRVGQESGAR